MIDYQALLTEARFLDTKPVKSHNMDVFVCGSCSCALGDISIRNGSCTGNGVEFNADIALRSIGSSLYGTEVRANFSGFSFTHAFLFMSVVTFRSGFKQNRCRETPAETAARIRKFVYYRLRKAEIFAEYNETLQTGKHAFQCEHGASQESMTQANGRTRELIKVT